MFLKLDLCNVIFISQPGAKVEGEACSDLAE